MKKIMDLESEINKELTEIQNLRDYRTAEDLGMSVIEIQKEISKHEKKIAKYRKMLSKTTVAA